MDKSIGMILKKGVVPEIININEREFERMQKIGSPLYISIREEGIEIG